MKNYINVITDTVFIKAFMNSLEYVFWSFVLGYLPPLVIAIVVNEMVYGKSAVKFMTYLPTIVPSVAASLMWYFMFQPGSGGVFNSIFNMIGIDNLQWLLDKKLTIPLIIVSVTWKSFGTAMVVYLANLQTLDQSLYEAAAIDGASVLTKVRLITFPHLYPIMLLSAIRQIIGIFQIMQQPLIMTAGGPDNASLSLGLQAYFYGFKYLKAGNALALGVIMFLLVISFTLFYFRVQKKLSEDY